MMTVQLLPLCVKYNNNKLNVIRVPTSNSVRIGLNNSRLDLLGPLIPVHMICSLTTTIDLL